MHCMPAAAAAFVARCSNLQTRQQQLLQTMEAGVLSAWLFAGCVTLGQQTHVCMCVRMHAGA
jgi:hypothetical protein